MNMTQYIVNSDMQFLIPVSSMENPPPNMEHGTSTPQRYYVLAQIDGHYPKQPGPKTLVFGMLGLLLPTGRWTQPIRNPRLDLLLMPAE